MAWNTSQMQAVLDRWSNRRQAIPPELIGKIAPTRLESINLRGVFRFPVDRYADQIDRKSTRLNSSHLVISYAVFCLKKKKNESVLTIRSEYAVLPPLPRCGALSPWVRALRAHAAWCPGSRPEPSAGCGRPQVILHHT